MIVVIPNTSFFLVVFLIFPIHTTFQVIILID